MDFFLWICRSFLELLETRPTTSAFLAKNGAHPIQLHIDVALELPHIREVHPWTAHAIFVLHGGDLTSYARNVSQPPLAT